VPVVVVVMLIAIAGCNQILGTSEARHGTCDPDVSFVYVAPVGGLESDLGDQSAQLSRDELTIVISRWTIAGSAAAPIARYGDLYTARREHLGDDFRDVVAMAKLNTDANELGASLSGDQHTLYIARGGRSLRSQILAAPWSTTAGSPGEIAPIALDDAGDSVLEPYVTASAIFFTARRADGSASLFSAPGQGTSFGPAERLRSIEGQTASAYGNPVVSSDELTLYFSAPPDNASQPDIWVSSRASRDQPFGAARAVAELNTPSGERPTWISEDSCRLYFVTNRTGRGYEVWLASRAAR
jgi:hypothetical protein